jgi:ribulose-phosphate 3-epimerase
MYTEFSASMMCAKFDNLAREVEELENAGIDGFHIDIMDGQFVPNFAMGFEDLKCIRRVAKKPVEVHLMILNPYNRLDFLIKQKVDVIYVHPEADYHPYTTLQKIIEAGITPGIAINPGTSLENVLELLYVVKRVLVMTVNPGQAGQTYLPYVGRKIERLLSVKDEYDFDIYWDGACRFDKIEAYASKGVKGFVLGTAIFKRKGTYAKLLSTAREYAAGNQQIDMGI